MKNFLKKIAFLMCSLLAVSCDKDQKLIAEIQGDYKIESIINFENGLGTPATFKSGTIFFENCKLNEGTGGNCNGWYQFEGKTKVTFQYNTRKEKASKIITITNLNIFSEPKITGSFEFDIDGNNLILNGIEETGGANGTTVTWYADIRLSK